MITDHRKSSKFRSILHCM